MVQSHKAASQPRMTSEEFVLKAIATLKVGQKYKGVHAVRSGFNQAFREYFGADSDPVAVTTQMRKDGKIAVFLSKGGASLYLREDLMSRTLEQHDADWEERDKRGFEKKAPNEPVIRGNALEKILKS